jgi:hypothetical protein
MAKPDSTGIPQWAEEEAWRAFREARDPRNPQNWKKRGAPSVGSRAGAILRNLMYPPSYIALCERALALYLGDHQLSERASNPQRVPERRKGLL